MADNLLTPYSYPVSEYTTDPEMRQERVSQALGWDTSRPWRELGMRALTQLPLALGPGRAAMPPMRVPAPAGPPRSVPERLTQGQRDLYELNPDRPGEFGPGAYSERRYLATPDPPLAQRYWDALGEFRLGPNTPQSVSRSNALLRGPTQGQRDFHSLGVPSGRSRYGEDAPVRAWETPQTQARALQYWDALRGLDSLPRPPRSRLNALLPFAGAAATAPWLVPDEPY